MKSIVSKPLTKLTRLSNKTNLLFASVIFTTFSFSQNYSLQWAKQMGGTGSDIIMKTHIDATGNIYNTGTFIGTADFDPGPGVSNLVSSGSEDIFIQKLDADGNFIWAKRVGGSSFDYGYSLTVDASGNVYAVGHFQGTADFDPGAGTSNLSSSGVNDGYVLKLNASGNFVWAKRMGGAGYDYCNEIALDASGNVYTVGSFWNTVDFDPGAGTFNMTVVGISDGFIQKLDASGNFIWAKQLGGTDSDNINSINFGASGNMYFSCTIRNTVDCDPGAGTSNFTAMGSYDLLILKLDASGNYVWAKQVGGAAGTASGVATLDALENIYVTSSFSGTVDFDPGAGTTNKTSLGNEDGFILKLDNNGNFIWVKHTGGIGNDGGSTEVSIDGNGNVYATGVMEGTVDFNLGGVPNTLTSAGNSDFYVFRLDASGNVEWLINLGSTEYDETRGIIFTPTGSLYVSGRFNGTVDFDPGAGITNLTSAGSSDVFLMKLKCQLNTTDVQTACDSYTWIDGITYFASNNTATYSVPGGAVGGCDSIVALNLTISDVIAPVPNTTSLLAINANCSVTSLTAPTATDNCAGTITGTHNASLPITTQGTTVVTWTYNDGHGNNSTQTQNMVINDNIAPVANTANLADISASCSVNSLTAPTATDNCTGTITGTHNASLPITTQGTTVVTWTYNDGHGNNSTQTQNIVINDNTAPVANTANLADISASCSVNSLTAPTATDNCAGTITGTHNASLPISTQGTTVVTWTYNDGHGNTTTQIQNVIIDDVTAPVPNIANLSNINANCDVTSLVTPAATDNCIGSITASHDVSLPITAAGTTVVTWTYDDGHGNTVTQTQNVIITPINATTAVNGITLTANQNGATYQWIDCGNNNATVPGATSQTFVPAANGSYAVIVTQNGCSDTSTCESVTTIGLETLNPNIWSLYPNPASEILSITTLKSEIILITDISGKIIGSEQLQAGNNTFKVSNLAPGVYFIQAIVGGKTMKFVKE